MVAIIDGRANALARSDAALVGSLEFHSLCLRHGKYPSFTDTGSAEMVSTGMVESRDRAARIIPSESSTLTTIHTGMGVVANKPGLAICGFADATHYTTYVSPGFN